MMSLSEIGIFSACSAVSFLHQPISYNGCANGCSSTEMTTAQKLSKNPFRAVESEHCELIVVITGN